MAFSASRPSRGCEANEKGPSFPTRRSSDLPAAYREYASVVASLAASHLDTFDRPLGTGGRGVIHRESGVLKTTYEADMALYPLPIARWTVAAIAAFMFVVLPLSVDEYWLSIVNIVSIATVGALGLNILVGYTGQISIGHGAFMSVGAYTAANFAVRLGFPFWLSLPLGGLMAAAGGGGGGRDSLAPHQGALPRDRDARRAAHHRVDHQSRDLHQRRGPGLHRG